MKSKAGHNRIAAGLMAIMLSFSLVWGGLLDFALFVSNAEAPPAAEFAEKSPAYDEASDADIKEQKSAVPEEGAEEKDSDKNQPEKETTSDEKYAGKDVADEAAENTTQGTIEETAEETTDKAAEEIADKGEGQNEEPAEPEDDTEARAEEQEEPSPKQAVRLKNSGMRGAGTIGTRKLTVTVTWENDDESVRPDNLTVHVKQTQSVLLPGGSRDNTGVSPIETKIKQIAGSGKANENNDNIKAIKYATDAQYEAVKEELTSVNEIQQSGEKTYMWFDPSDGTMYMYSDAGTIYLNTNSGGMFRKMKELEDISGLSHLDTSHVQDINRMFQDSAKIVDFSPISGWDVSYVQNFDFAFGALKSNADYPPMAMSSFEFMRDWNVLNATTLDQTFKGCSSVPSLEPIKDWDVSKVTIFKQTFNWCTSLTEDTRAYIDGWDVRAASNFDMMFANSEGTLTEPNFTLRPGTFINNGNYSTSIPAVTPDPPDPAPSIPTVLDTEYTDDGSGHGDGSNVGDCVVTKNGNVWTYEFTVPDNDGKWYVWEETNDGSHIDDKNGLSNAYTESSDGTDGLGGSENDAIKGVTSSASITNTNTKRVEITVKKKWQDDNNSYNLRPADVNIELNYNGSKVGETNADASKWNKSGNEWVYTTLVHYSDGTGTYTIDENPITGYSGDGPQTVTLSSTADGNTKTGEATITNTLDTHDLKVTKEVTGNQADKTKEFAFRFTTNAAGALNYEIKMSNGSLKSSGTFRENGSFKLKDGEYIEVKDIPAIYTYQVEESDYSAEGYSTTVTMIQQGSGDTITDRSVDGTMDADKDITYDNNKSGALPTGLFSNSSYLLIMMAAALLGILIMVIFAMRKRRADDYE